jgi:hypothetical protein
MLYARLSPELARKYFIKQLISEASQYPNLLSELARPNMLLQELTGLDELADDVLWHWLPANLALRVTHQSPTGSAPAPEKAAFPRSWRRAISVDALPFPLWSVNDREDLLRPLVTKSADEVVKRGSVAQVFELSHFLALVARFSRSPEQQAQVRALAAYDTWLAERLEQLGATKIYDIPPATGRPARKPAAANPSNAMQPRPAPGAAVAPAPPAADAASGSVSAAPTAAVPVSGDAGRRLTDACLKGDWDSLYLLLPSDAAKAIEASSFAKVMDSLGQVLSAELTSVSFGASEPEGEKILATNNGAPFTAHVVTLTSRLLLTTYTTVLALFTDTAGAPAGFAFPSLIARAEEPVSRLLSVGGGGAGRRFALAPRVGEVTMHHRRFTYTAPAGESVVVGCLLPSIDSPQALDSVSLSCSDPSFRPLTLPDLSPHAAGGSGACLLFAKGPCTVTLALQYTNLPSRLVYGTEAELAAAGVGTPDDGAIGLAPPRFAHTYGHARALPGQASAAFASWLRGAGQQTLSPTAPAEAVVATARAVFLHMCATLYAHPLAPQSTHVGTLVLGEALSTPTPGGDDAAPRDTPAAAAAASSSSSLSPALAAPAPAAAPVSASAPASASSEVFAQRVGARVPVRPDSLPLIYAAALRALAIPARLCGGWGYSLVQFHAPGVGWVPVDAALLQPALWGNVTHSDPLGTLGRPPLLDLALLMSESDEGAMQLQQALDANMLFVTMVHALGSAAEVFADLLSPELQAAFGDVAHSPLALAVPAAAGAFLVGEAAVRVHPSGDRAVIRVPSATSADVYVWTLKWASSLVTELALQVTPAAHLAAQDARYADAQQQQLQREQSSMSSVGAGGATGGGLLSSTSAGVSASAAATGVPPTPSVVFSQHGLLMSPRGPGTGAAGSAASDSAAAAAAANAAAAAAASASGGFVLRSYGTPKRTFPVPQWDLELAALKVWRERIVDHGLPFNWITAAVKDGPVSDATAEATARPPVPVFPKIFHRSGGLVCWRVDAVGARGGEGADHEASLGRGQWMQEDVENAPGRVEVMPRRHLYDHIPAAPVING